MPLNTVTIFSWYQSDWAKEFMQSVHRASRPPGMAYFIIAPIIIISMNLKLCKFPRVHLTRFRLVQRQSATVTAHSWALSCTLSCAWFYCFLRSYKSTLQLCGLSEHVDVAFITNQKWVWLLSDCYVLWKVLVQAMRGVFQESCEYYIQCFLYTHNMLLRRLNIRHMRNKWRAVNIYILPPVRQF